MRKLKEIAFEIESEISNKDFYYYAKPYVEAMKSLDTIQDRYYEDSAYSVVCYALSNLRGWKGEKAKAIKAELKEVIK